MSEASQVQIQDARTEYTRRWEARRACSARYQRQHMRLGNARLQPSLLRPPPWPGSLSGTEPCRPGGCYCPVSSLGLVLVHARVIRRRDCASRAAALYEKGLARLADRWAGAGVSGERFLDRAHPYAEDLDLFGRGSLFELLCTTRTRTGEETLARWLLGPASPEEVRARQVAVAELRPRLDLREELALVGEDLRSGISPQALAAWSEDLPSLASRHARITAAVLSSLALVSAALWAVLHRPAPFLAVVLVIMVFSLRLRPRVQRIIQRIGEPAYGLELLSLVLVRFERERFTSPSYWNSRPL